MSTSFKPHYYAGLKVAHMQTDAVINDPRSLKQAEQHGYVAQGIYNNLLRTHMATR